MEKYTNVIFIDMKFNILKTAEILDNWIQKCAQKKKGIRKNKTLKEKIKEFIFCMFYYEAILIKITWHWHWNNQ